MLSLPSIRFGESDKAPLMTGATEPVFGHEFLDDLVDDGILINPCHDRDFGDAEPTIVLADRKSVV